jgi:hypothetical protein
MGGHHLLHAAPLMGLFAQCIQFAWEEARVYKQGTSTALNNTCGGVARTAVKHGNAGGERPHPGHNFHNKRRS